MTVQGREKDGRRRGRVSAGSAGRDPSCSARRKNGHKGKLTEFRSPGAGVLKPLEVVGRRNLAKVCAKVAEAGEKDGNRTGRKWKPGGSKFNTDRSSAKAHGRSSSD